MSQKDIFNNNRLATDGLAALSQNYLLDPVVAEKLKVNQSNNNDFNKNVLIADLVDFDNHPFTVNTNDDDFKELVQSIRENGVIADILVRPVGEKYEIISGHRRVAASKEAGLTEIPAQIKELSDYEATVLMVHSNLYREKILHSEKAKAYRMIRDSEKHQGRSGSDTAAEIGKGHDSRRNVYRYIKLSYLLDELLEYIDAGNIAFQSGVELAFLSEESQKDLLKFIRETGIFPSLEKSTQLKEAASDEKGLDFNRIVAILAPPKIDKGAADEEKLPKPKTKISFKCQELAENYFIEGTEPEVMEKTIVILLKKYAAGEISIENEFE